MASVSICVPTLNARHFLKARMDSIYAQTFSDWELIVCDSHSDDGTWEFAQQFATDSRVRLYQVPREGLYAGWNECLARATGEYVYFAPADDTMTPLLLEKCVASLQLNPKSEVVVCDFDEIDHSGKIITKEESWHRRFYGTSMNEPVIRTRLAEFLATLCLGTPWFTMTSVFFRRSLFDRTGPFPTRLGSHGDNLWTARATLAGDVVYLPERLATFRRHETQATVKYINPDLSWNLYSAFRELLDEVKADLPISWTDLPDWQKRLLNSRLRIFRDSLKLERWRLRTRPKQFLQSLFVAWRTQRTWLLQQAAKGFLASPEFDPVPASLSLVSEFLDLACEPRFRPFPRS